MNTGIKIHVPQKEFVVYTMIRNDIFANATLNVTVSFLVKAKNKAHAIKMADFQINEETVILDQVQLMNEQGMEKLLKVKRVEAIHWTAADPAEYSSQYKVTGHICLALCIPITREQMEENLWETAYKLPKSSFQDITVLIIPTLNEPAFTQVISQSLEWNVKSRPSASLIKAV
jgi:hypothetical protein